MCSTPNKNQDPAQTKASPPQKDVSVNKPFKGILRNVLDELMETMSEKELEALDDVTDSAVGRRRVLMTRAVGEAWERVGSILSFDLLTSADSRTSFV